MKWLAFVGFVIVAVVSAVALSDWGNGVSETSVWLARGAFVAVGAAIGWLRGRPSSNLEVALACLAPVLLLVFAGVLMAGLSNSAADLPQIPVILGAALALFDLPLLAGVALARRSSAARPGS